MVVNNSKIADGRHFENRYIAISQQKTIHFRWNFVHTSRFWTGWTSRDQKRKSCIGQTPSLTEGISCSLKKLIWPVPSILSFRHFTIFQSHILSGWFKQNLSNFLNLSKLRPKYCRSLFGGTRCSIVLTRVECLHKDVIFNWLVTMTVTESNSYLYWHKQQYSITMVNIISKLFPVHLLSSCLLTR